MAEPAVLYVKDLGVKMIDIDGFLREKYEKRKQRNKN